MKGWKYASALALAIAAIGAGSTVMAEVGREGLPSVDHVDRTQRPERPRFTQRTNLPSREVRLPARSVREVRALEAARREAGPGRPIVLGGTRELAAVDRIVDGRALQWTAVPGGHVAELGYSAEGARALRLRFTLVGPAHGVTLRFGGSAKPDEVAEVAGADALRTPRYWAPVVEGARMRVEIFVADGVQHQRVRLANVALMHLDAITPSSLANGQGPLGQATLACQQDVNCNGDQSDAWKQLLRSVVGVGFTRPDGQTGWCTGTLVNSNTVPRKPYIVTASHCVNTAEAAASMFVVFFLESAACGSREARAESIAIGGGATLLTTTRSSDFSLLEWNGRVPGGVAFAGWNASGIGTGTDIAGVHHPGGDFKKYSLGRKSGEVRNVRIALPTGTETWEGPFHQVSWRLGAIEQGSSGSGLFAFDGSGYRLVGQLVGYAHSGAATCGSIANYGRFENVFASTRSWLDQPNPLAVVDSASYRQREVAADLIVASFGASLPQEIVPRVASDRVRADDSRCLLSLGGRYSMRVRSTTTGRTDEACLSFIGNRQVNAILPSWLVPGDRVDIQVMDGTSVVATSPASPVTAFAPGFFTGSQDGKGAPAGNIVRVRAGQQTLEAIPPTGQSLDLGPADEELFLVLYGTGLRGKAAATRVTATIAGVPASVEYFGAQPTYLGLDQVNLRIPKQALRDARVSGKALLEVRFTESDGREMLANAMELTLR